MRKGNYEEKQGMPLPPKRPKSSKPNESSGYKPNNSSGDNNSSSPNKSD